MFAGGMDGICDYTGKVLPEMQVIITLSSTENKNIKNYCQMHCKSKNFSTFIIN